jgi:hypothetical protein
MPTDDWSRPLLDLLSRVVVEDEDGTWDWDLYRLGEANLLEAERLARGALGLKQRYPDTKREP